MLKEEVERWNKQMDRWTDCYTDLKFQLVVQQKITSNWPLWKVNYLAWNLTLISVGSFVHLQRGHVSKWYIAFICPVTHYFSSILSQNYLKRKMTYLSTSKQQFLVFQKGIKRVWHNSKLLPRSYSIIPEPLVIESRNSGFRFLFGYFLS